MEARSPLQCVMLVRPSLPNNHLHVKQAQMALWCLLSALARSKLQYRWLADLQPWPTSQKRCHSSWPQVRQLPECVC